MITKNKNLFNSLFSVLTYCYYQDDISLIMQFLQKLVRFKWCDSYTNRMSFVHRSIKVFGLLFMHHKDMCYVINRS